MPGETFLSGRYTVLKRILPDRNNPSTIPCTLWRDNSRRHVVMSASLRSPTNGPVLHVPHDGMLRARGKVRGRAEHLMPRERGEELRLVQVIQLREDIIQENDRLLASLELQIRNGEEEHGEYGGTLLPAGGKCSEGTPLDGDRPIFAVRADGRREQEEIALTVVEEQCAEFLRNGGLIARVSLAEGLDADSVPLLAERAHFVTD